MRKEHIETLKKLQNVNVLQCIQVGDVTGDHRFTFESATKGDKPMDLALSDMFGSSPKTIMTITL